MMHFFVKRREFNFGYNKLETFMYHILKMSKRKLDIRLRP